MNRMDDNNYISLADREEKFDFDILQEITILDNLCSINLNKIMNYVNNTYFNDFPLRSFYISYIEFFDMKYRKTDSYIQKADVVLNCILFITNSRLISPSVRYLDYSPYVNRILTVLSYLNYEATIQKNKDSIEVYYIRRKNAVIELLISTTPKDLLLLLLEYEIYNTSLERKEYLLKEIYIHFEHDFSDSGAVWNAIKKIMNNGIRHTSEAKVDKAIKAFITSYQDREKLYDNIYSLFLEFYLQKRNSDFKKEIDGIHKKEPKNEHVPVK